MSKETKATLIDPDKPIFKCHDMTFTSSEQLENHYADVEHEHEGYGVCKDCGAKDIPFKVKIKLQPGMLPPVYCVSCLDRLRKLL